MRRQYDDDQEETSEYDRGHLRRQDSFTEELLKEVVRGTTTAVVIILLLLLCNHVGLWNCNCDCIYNNYKTEQIQNLKQTQNDEPIGNYSVEENRIAQETEETIENLADQTITFSGYGEYQVSKTNPNVELMNPEKNKELGVDFVFTLTDIESGDVIAKTGKVEPGKFVYVNVYDYYKNPGTYEANVKIETSAEDGSELNGLNQKMKITIN